MSRDFLHKIYMGVAELFCILIRVMAVLFLRANSIATRPSLVASYIAYFLSLYVQQNRGRWPER